MKMYNSIIFRSLVPGNVINNNYCRFGKKHKKMLVVGPLSKKHFFNQRKTWTTKICTTKVYGGRGTLVDLCGSTTKIHLFIFVFFPLRKLSWTNSVFVKTTVSPRPSEMLKLLLVLVSAIQLTRKPNSRIC